MQPKPTRVKLKPMMRRGVKMRNTKTSSLFLRPLARCGHTLTRTQLEFPSSNTRRESGGEVKAIHLHFLHLHQLLCTFGKGRGSYILPTHQPNLKCHNEISKKTIK